MSTPELSAADKILLARVCRVYLTSTRWAGELGDPMPELHMNPVDRRNVTEIRHARELCRRLCPEVK